MYAVGDEYAHAEARKAPTLDGKVLRDHGGNEVRYPVVLSYEEKAIANKVVAAFGQFICGFDVLRSFEGSFVCDVNGFSFVKKSKKYYDDTVFLVRTLILNALVPTREMIKFVSGGMPVLALEDEDEEHTDFEEYKQDGLPDEYTCTTTNDGLIANKDRLELRCVVAVVRYQSMNWV